MLKRIQPAQCLRIKTRAVHFYPGLNFTPMVMPELHLPGVSLQISITLLLCAVGLLACYFSARRAGRIDPVIALRVD